METRSARSALLFRRRHRDRADGASDLGLVEALARSRPVLGRALFVGDVASRKSLAGLYSLVATCESRGINPFDYLADVLGRVQDHPANAIANFAPAGTSSRR